MDKVVGYAQAIFHLAEAEDALDQVSDELFRVAKAVEQNYELRNALTDIAIPAERKEAMLNELLGDRTSPHTRNILNFIISQGRARDLVKIVETVSNLAAEARQREVAEVRVAVPLDESQRQKLAEALEHATGKRVEVKAIVDPSIVGGVFAKVGDKVIDGTVRHRLQSLKERLEAQG